MALSCFQSIRPVFSLLLSLVVLPVLIPTFGFQRPEPGVDVPENFKTENLVGWCIVPFDAKHRGPAERAEMVKRLGLNRVAYDWREQHVPQFEQEIQQYQKNGIEYFAFWQWHDSMEPLIKKYGIKPQIWLSCKAPKQGTQEEKVQGAAEQLLPLVEKTRSLGLKLGIYNHGGWNGQPENMIAVCEYLRAIIRPAMWGSFTTFTTATTGSQDSRRLSRS